MITGPNTRRSTRVTISATLFSVSSSPSRTTAADPTSALNGSAAPSTATVSLNWRSCSAPSQTFHQRLTFGPEAARGRFVVAIR
mgnify:CR=1 FL=1